jgi:histidyl-tRNA synthetase
MNPNISIPKGTRDFLPVETERRNYIFDTIRKVFQRFGYAPIETPAMENLSTLLGKYGEEGDRLIFKILNSGNFIEGITNDDFLKTSPNALSSKICEKALRYDLTVPFARYVVMHRNELTFPFKRYQIQPVWRADRPQKGRYREFYQCDVDVIGSNSLLNEVELIQIVDQVFGKFLIPVVVKLNNRKVLTGIAEYIGHPDKIIDITVAIDKLDKIGVDNVIKELLEKGISDQAIELLKPLFSLGSDSDSKLNDLEKILKNSVIGLKGIEEIRTVFSYLEEGVKSKVEFDLTLARGLNYYTGAIFEVKAQNVEMGSICGGGRYDDLTGIFGMPDVSGVGISFGADRIYDVLNQLKSFPTETGITTKVLFVNFGEEETKHCLQYAAELRNSGINCEVYPDTVKMKKQFEYADKKNIPFVVIAGSEEIKAGTLTLKNMKSGEQQKMTPDEIKNQLTSQN